MDSVKKQINKIRECYNQWNRYHILDVLVCLFFFGVQYFIFQVSTVPNKAELFQQGPFIILYNSLLMGLITLLLYVFIQKISVSILVSSCFISVLSIISYYTLKYHGSPLFPSELSNFFTAMNVAGRYSYEINSYVKKILLLATFMILCSIFYVMIKREKGWSLKRAGISFVFFALLAVILVIPLMSDGLIKPKNSMTSFWAHGVIPYGMPMCYVEDIDKTINYLQEPEGYNVEKIDNLAVYKNKDTTNQYPDVILILNETFYDMNNYMEIPTDVPVLDDFYGLDNAIYGLASVPGVGGGTNNSEYELLTLNSMYLLKNGYPFNYLDLTKNHNNVVQYFNSLGYHTYGMHPVNGINYSRHIGYPGLGFEYSILPLSEKEDIISWKKNYYGNRPYLDIDNYHDMIDFSNTLDHKPRFAYLLTYQNHGSFHQNAPEDALVHVQKDFGSEEYNSALNEYLSTIKLSGEAFVELTEYYQNVDRPTIICMVGDHAPSFISNFNDPSLSEEQDRFKKQAVPYVIWANFPIQTDKNTDHLALNTLMPLILDICDMPLTTYQKEILDLHQEVPVVLSNGSYYDKDGNISEVNKKSPYYEDIMKYFYMEYNSLGSKENYRKVLFESIK